MATVMTEHPGAAFLLLADIVENTFQADPRFAMTEDAVRILFSELFKRFADSVEKGDLPEKIAHFRAHGAEFLDMMRKHLPDDELRRWEIHKQPLTITGAHVTGLVNEISNRWFPDGPSGDHRKQGRRR